MKRTLTGLTIPISLPDIVSAFGTMFQSLWPLLGFLAAIPITFGIVNRIIGTSKSASRGHR